MSQQLKKLEQQRDSLLSEVDDLADQFTEIRSGVDPDNVLPLMDARLIIRDKIQDQNIDSLKERFGRYFDYVKFNQAMEKVDEKLGEDPEIFRARGRELSMQHRLLHGKEQTPIIRSKHKGLER